jgi:hypothetical protein
MKYCEFGDCGGEATQSFETWQIKEVVLRRALLFPVGEQPKRNPS